MFRPYLNSNYSLRKGQELRMMWRPLNDVLTCTHNF
jgi:hypothetical protein